ncbi:MAG TPA: hypothetical protein VNN80_10680, partial [Polyangiaceae bacterium]|nr:hypothetical protein [Polyangiaceae bacterium]
MTLGGASLLTLALGGCSGTEEEQYQAAELQLETLVNLGQCSAAWVPITGGNRSDSEPPTELMFSRGGLFFFRFQWGPDGTASSELVRFDVHSESRALATTVLVPNAYSAPLWEDDGELVFTQNGEVHSVPMLGGPTRVRSTFGAVDLGDIRWLGIREGNFYFARYGQPGAIWRVSLDGGPVGLFANLGPDWGYQLEPPLVQSTEGLLLSGRRRMDSRTDRELTILISGDGSTRELPAPEASAWQPFLTPSGVIHIVDRPQPLAAADDAAEDPAEPSTPEFVRKVSGNGPTNPGLDMWLAPLRGEELTPFWLDRPAAVRPNHVESDGRDGWFITATEPFNDGFLHDTLWHVRPNAAARRLACNPSAESFQIQT